MEDTTRRLAQFLSHVQFEELAQGVIDQAKKCLLDFTGVAIAGAKGAASEKIFNFFKNLGGPAEASVFKYAHKTSSPLAALINGSMAHGLELDDGHILAHAHPGVTTIPAAVAIGEKIRSTGKDLLTAIVTGYEPVIRIGNAITPSALYDRGIHTAALVGSLGASTAVGKLLHLDEEKMLHALGNCCLTPIAPFQTFKEGATIKDLYGGWPAFVGTIAGSMAGEGFTGPIHFLEGPMGLCKNVSDDYDLVSITENMGEPWSIMGVYFKRHASCSLSHTTMDATLALVESNRIVPDEITKVTVKIHRFASDLNEKAPKTPTAAKTSIPFCVALCVIRRCVSLGEFSLHNIKDEKIGKLAQKVEVQLNPELDQIHLAREDLRPSIVEIHMKEGQVFTERKDTAKGWAVDPLSDKELEEKFLGLAQTSLSKEKALRILDMVWEMDNLQDIRLFIEEIKEFKS
ncbi:MAG: MmgE/PrpD family protein [Pseudomonadota bacterium]